MYKHVYVSVRKEEKLLQGMKGKKKNIQQATYCCS